jgi:hypothetical protein
MWLCNNRPSFQQASLENAKYIRGKAEPKDMPYQFRSCYQVPGSPVQQIMYHYNRRLSLNTLLATCRGSSSIAGKQGLTFWQELASQHPTKTV